MTDNEIIKALECCSKADCNNCPASKFGNCIDIVMEEAIALIDRQKGEVERLKEDNEALNSAVSSALDIVNSNYQNGRAEAIKEFADKLKKKLARTLLYLSRTLIEDIDDLVREMVGADNAD